ncbi:MULTISPECIES: hypothetical protein [Chelativorans]|uniref:Secreted protein n=1 Tax=Chelativorans sp. (strain BNC1) TaxID=266779 RepID=Q11MI4_CHESB
MQFLLFMLSAAMTTFVGADASAVERPAGPPVGVYLWYPNASAMPTDQDCEKLVADIQPSRSKAEDWLWGRVPEGDDSREVEFYLWDRMEPTFAAEGDYDSGSVVWESTATGTTSFTLTPDDHPDTSIRGTIRTSPEGKVLSVTLKGIPLDGGAVDRTTYYCSFDDIGVET